MVKVGITGSIATGKSTVSGYLKNLGQVVIDADEVARYVVPSVKEKLIEAFGLEILTEAGELDRKKLGKFIFSDPFEKQKLNSIIHPKILEEIKNRIERYEKEGTLLVFIDAALMIETGSYKNYDYLIVVYCDRDTQLKRLVERDKIDKTEAENKINSQLSIEEKIKYADFIIDNCGSLQKTHKQIEDLLFFFCKQ